MWEILIVLRCFWILNECGVLDISVVGWSVSVSNISVVGWSVARLGCVTMFIGGRGGG